MSISRAGDHLICPGFKILIMYSTEKFLCISLGLSRYPAASEEEEGRLIIT